jgi:DUF1009 family protein
MSRWRKLGVIAGSGGLPVKIAAASAARGAPFHIIRLAGIIDPALLEMPGDDCAIGEAGKIIRILKRENCDAAVFAGHVPRPDFSSLKADWRGAAMLPKVLAAAARGDGALLSVLVETLESEGIIVIGVEEAAQGLTAPAGALGALSPNAQNMADIRKAAHVVQVLGPFDVGQGAVVAGGLVLAIEAAEGTDAMLARCAMLPNGVNQGGVLVKRPKPGQELRIDLPVVGAETVRCAARAGLAGIAVEEGVALIIDIDEVTGLADKAGLFVYGFTAHEVTEP